MGLPADIERYREGVGETHAREKGEERLISIDAIQCPNKCIGIIAQKRCPCPQQDMDHPSHVPKELEMVGPSTLQMEN